MKMLKQSCCIFTLLIFCSVLSHGQNVTHFKEIRSTQISENDVIAKISENTLIEACEVVVDSFFIKEPLPLTSHTHQDSLSLQYNEYNVLLKRARIDPAVLSNIIPEVVNYDHHNNPSVDYNSLVVYLLIALHHQQDEIADLRKTIGDMENISTTK